MRFVVIGGNPAGLSAASGVKRSKPDWDVIVYEMGQYVSYGSCGLPYYIFGTVKRRQDLITLTPEDLREKRDIELCLWHKVTGVDFDNKTLTVRDIEGDREFTDEYDILLIATGAKAKLDPEKGLTDEHPRIFCVHTIADADCVRDCLMTTKINHAVVIGGGYIGLEMIEAYKEFDVDKITIIGPRLVFKSKSQELVVEELEKNGINLVCDQYVKQVETISETELKIILEDDSELTADFVQISIGVVPNTDIFKASGLKMTKGAIITDEYMRTNIKDVYAAGDCSTAYHRILKKHKYIPLAPAANKQGRIAGKYISGKKIDPFAGVVGTAVWKVLNLYCGRTGINMEEALNQGYNSESVMIQANEVAHYYPNMNNQFKKKMSVLLVFDRVTHLLLGAEITAPTPLGGKKIDVLATALQAEMTIDDLQKLDLSYAPPFSAVWDPILIAANIARKKCQ